MFGEAGIGIGLTSRITYENEHTSFSGERAIWSVGLCGEDPLLLDDTDHRMKIG
ncbi:MAG: hypothetical protein HC927_02710 [Deltaproteobacteria bacterium]|nr:hypothetical protein [Deltaproteobacteria bacterium]